MNFFLLVIFKTCKFHSFTIIFYDNKNVIQNKLKTDMYIKKLKYIYIGIILIKFSIIYLNAILN